MSASDIYKSIKGDYLQLSALTLKVASENYINDKQTELAYSDKSSLMINNANHIDIIEQINKIDQSGGGAWSTYSSGNDSTHDMLSEYKVTEFDSEKNDFIYHNQLKDTDKSLKLMFADYEKRQNEVCKKSHTHIKTNDEIDFCDCRKNYAYLGVIMWMIESGYPIRVRFLYRALVMAYYEYFMTVTIKEASGWRTWINRRDSLIDEIHLINYVINTAKHGVAQITFDRKDLYKKISNISKKTPVKIMDRYFIHHKNIKPNHPSMKYCVEPGVDPRLLKVGTVMMGHSSKRLEPFIVTLNNKNKKIWALFDTWESDPTFFMEDKFVTDLYGREYYRLIKRTKFKLPAGLE